MNPSAKFSPKVEIAAPFIRCAVQNGHAMEFPYDKDRVIRITSKGASANNVIITMESKCRPN